MEYFIDFDHGLIIKIKFIFLGDYYINNVIKMQNLVTDIEMNARYAIIMSTDSNMII